MPNHTDCRMYIVAPKDNLTRLMIRVRAWDGVEGAGKKAKVALRDDPAGFWGKALARSEWGAGLQKSAESEFGCERRGGFSLNIGNPMPSSLHVEKSSTGETGRDILEGDWTSPIRWPQWKEKMGAQPPSSREEMIAWAEKNAPEMLTLGRQLIENVDKYGYPTWYEWSIANWGTKWDTYDVVWRSMKTSSGKVRVDFNTAWSPPLPAIKALCEKMGVSAVIGYVDEGGGFADYSKYGPEGELQRNAMPGASAPWKAIATEAKEMAEALTLEERKGTMPKWIGAMLEGKEPSEKLLKGAYCPKETLPADIVMASLLDGGEMTSQRAIEWLDLLEKAKIVGAGSKTSEGKTLAEAFADQCWLEGIMWASQRLEEDEREDLMAAGLASAMRRNAPRAAVFCYGNLPEELRPKGAALAQGASALRTMAELADAFEIDDETFGLMVASAKTSEQHIQSYHKGSEYEKMLDRLSAMDEARKIKAAAPAKKRKSRGMSGGV